MHSNFVTVKILLIIPFILTFIKSSKWLSKAERHPLITKERSWWHDLIWVGRKEICVWHLPEQLLLIVYPRHHRDKNELKRREESSLSLSSQPRGKISETCCTLTAGWLHSLENSLISWMRKEGVRKAKVIEEESRHSSMRNNPFFLFFC